MKKLYASPAPLAAHDAIRETLVGGPSSFPEAVNPLIYWTRFGGSVGFFL